MVLVCHESNDIFLEAAKVGWRAGELANVAGLANVAVLPWEVTDQQHQEWAFEVKAAAVWLHLSQAVALSHMGPCVPQMARYAKHESMTTFIFVGEA